jgi:phosphoglycolate phosphatase-like HAD superfamily hydrolase
MEETKGLIFDLDGTLADTLPLCMISFREAMKNVTGELPPEEEVAKYWGYSEIGIVKKLYPQKWEVCLQEFLKVYKDNHEMCVELFEGMHSTLNTLKMHQINLALVTGKGKDSCKITMRELGLGGYFNPIETGSEIGSIKPECIERVLKNWNMTPDDVYYIGDSVNDIKDSKKVGVKAIAAAWAKTADIKLLEKEDPEMIFYSINDFHAWIDDSLKRKHTVNLH